MKQAITSLQYLRFIHFSVEFGAFPEPIDDLIGGSSFKWLVDAGRK